MMMMMTGVGVGRLLTFSSRRVSNKPLMPYKHRFVYYFKRVKEKRVRHLCIYFSSFFLSVLFQNSETKRGMFHRISGFFKKKKSSSSRGHSESDAGSPTSPLSPRLVQFLHEDGLKSPPQLNCELAWPHYAGKKTGAGHGKTLTQSPSLSDSSASLQTSDTDFPFADSNSSSQGSVRQVYVCRVSTTGSEKNSGNVTPTAVDYNSGLPPLSSSEPGFAESLVREVSKRLDASMEEGLSEGKRGRQSKTPGSKAEDGPESSHVTTYKTSMKVGEKRHSTTIKEIRLGSQSPSSRLIRTKREEEVCSDSVARKRAQAFSPETVDADSPVVLHKAIWVETHLGEEEEREGTEEKDTMKEWEGFRADSPPVLAIPVTVIPEDDSQSLGSAESPATPTETLPRTPTSPTAGESQTPSPQPEGSDTGKRSKQGSLTKRKPRELRVTRKTVNLPSKVYAHKVYIDPSLDGEEPTGEERSGDLSSETSGTAEEKQ